MFAVFSLFVFIVTDVRRILFVTGSDIIVDIRVWVRGLLVFFF